MPRLYISNNRGRQSTLSGRRTPRLKERKDETYQETSQKKKKGGAKYSTTTPTKVRSRQTAARNATEDESTTSGVGSADEGDAEEEDDDDDDEPAVTAPSRAFHLHETGRYQYDRSDDNLSEAGESESMFGGSYNPEEEEELQNRLMDDNDDAYQAVDDISESDLDDDKIMEEQTKFLLADIFSAPPRDESEDPSFYLNQIEGMSAYGFGDESEDTMQLFGSSQSSDSGNEPLNRRVRFEEMLSEPPALRYPESPTMTRALLPSALPMMLNLSGDIGNGEDSDISEDSDLTDVDFPKPVFAPSDMETHQEKACEDVPTPSSLPKNVRAPPYGRFVDDGVQSAGILDRTGTRLLITNPRSLGEEFARRYGVSVPASPGPDFAEAVLGIDSHSPETPNTRVPDPMFSGLTSRANATADGQTVGIPEAFHAPCEGIPQLMGTISERFDGDASVFSDLDEAEQTMRIEDIVAFDSDSESASPTSPMMGYDIFSSPGLSHLTNGDLMAFRRNADPLFRALQSSPMTGHGAAARAARAGNSNRAQRAAKRKAVTESPYKDQYYKGVTPVQRVSFTDNDLPMLASSPTKKQRLF